MKPLRPSRLPSAVLLPVLLAAAALLPVRPALAQQGLAVPESAKFERLQVIDPFIELRTGPGRGFPVTYVAEKGAFVTIELRRTDWYRVSTAAPQGLGGTHTGWVHRSQLAGTITEAGGTKTFRDLVVDDYLARRVEFGAGWGRFKGEPMLRFWGAYRLGETLGVEASYGQVQGVFSGTDFWHLSLVSEPWSDRRLSPYLSVGLGKFRNFPNTSLVGAIDTNANLGHAGLGLRWYVAERFVLRLDWSLYTAFVSDARSLEYRAVTLGVSFFF